MEHKVSRGTDLKTRHCKHCDTTKPISQFNKDKTNKSGYYYRCKLCKSKDSKKWRLENPERVKQLNLKHNEIRDLKKSINENQPEFYEVDEGLFSLQFMR